MWIELPIKQYDGELEEKMGIIGEGHEAVYLVRHNHIISMMPDRTRDTNEPVSSICVAGEGWTTVYMPFDKLVRFLLHVDSAEDKHAGVYTVDRWENGSDKTSDVYYEYEYHEG